MSFSSVLISTHSSANFYFWYRTVPCWTSWSYHRLTFQSCQGPSDGIPFLRNVDSTSQHDAISKFVWGGTNPTVQVANKYIKCHKSKYWSLRTVTSHCSLLRHWALTNTVIPIQKVTKFVKQNLPIMKPCWLTSVTSVFSIYLSMTSIINTSKV